MIDKDKLQEYVARDTKDNPTFLGADALGENGDVVKR